MRPDNRPCFGDYVPDFYAAWEKGGSGGSEKASAVTKLRGREQWALGSDYAGCKDVDILCLELGAWG